MKKVAKLHTVLMMLLSLVLMAGCTDDLDLTVGPEAGGIGDPDGGLMFAIGDTRGGFEGSHESALSQSEEEIVINPNNFHVVLFSEKGEVKQIWANQELTEFTEWDESMGTMITKYYVKIPRHDMDSEVVNYIRTNKFKLAVFANWDGYPDFSTTVTTETNGISRNNIFYISHCRADGSYASSGTDGQLDDSDVFKFITGPGFKMGIAQEWVCERFKTDADADRAIRDNYTLNDDGTGEFLSNTKPILTDFAGNQIEFSAMDDYTYYDVWNVWNFGGETNKSYTNFYKSGKQSIRDKWASINNDWYYKLFDPYTTDSRYYSLWMPGSTKFRGLTVESPDWTGNDDLDGRSIVYGSRNDYGHSLVLRRTYRETTSDQTIDVAQGSYIHFLVPADGYLYIKCRAWETGANPTLVVRRGKKNSTGSSIAVMAKTVNSNSVQELSYDYTEAGNKIVRVSGEPEDLCIYAVGGDIIIYEIEYIKSRTLQTVDRQMINPASTPEGGISMYGIQDFNPVPTTIWPDGTTFNLSRDLNIHTGQNESNYKYRTISLLRSVAKVEVLVPTWLFPEPSHMFMRTLNRFSRSAPIDVFTPTNIIWNGWNSTSDYREYGVTTVTDKWNNTHKYNQAQGVDVEAKAIRQKGFTYKKGSTDVAEYRNEVSWLFGVWADEYGWNWGGENINWNSKGGPYPNLFNTRISRSDYAHMINGGKIIHTDGQEYYYYYAYVPEKNVTDPNDKGTLGEDPKVIRIEMRFADRNSDVNLDDNASYRIYFTPGGKGNGINSRDDYDGAMEKGDSDGPLQNLKDMYPVMRNHLYRFRITGLEMNELNVDFEVKGPETRDINYTFE